MPLFRKLFLIAGFILAAGCFLAAKFLYPFLAISRPVQGQLLIVEGFIPDYALRDACRYFQEHSNYKYLVITSQKKECADNPAETSCRNEAVMEMLRGGVDPKSIIAIPDQKSARGSRTYESAVATKQELQKLFGNLKSVDVFTHAFHGRKSFVMFKKVFEKDVNVGIISGKPQLFDSERWWISKTGLWMAAKGVAGYVYAEIFILFK